MNDSVNENLSLEEARDLLVADVDVAVQAQSESQITSSNVEPIPEAEEPVPEVVSVESSLDATVSDSIRFVLVGDGLSGIWQNTERAEWHLLLAILQACELEPAHLKVFDTAHLETEEATFDVMDQIIELGLDMVFAFDENSVLLDYLQEGIQVERMPSLSEMLTQPKLKQTCYKQLQPYFL